MGVVIGFGPEGMPGRLCVISWVILTSVLNGKSLILSEDDIYVRSWTFVVPPPSLSLDATVIIDNRWQS